MIIRLEYNEKRGSFHTVEPDEPQKNILGLKTVYPHLDYEIAARFTEWIHKRHRFIPDSAEEIAYAHFTYPSYNLVKAEFALFCKDRGL